VVDMGLNSINISIYKQGKLFFFRNTAYGFQHIIHDLSHNLGLTEQDIEKVISERGIPQVSFDPKDRVAIAEEIMRQKYEAGGDRSLPETKRGVNPLELRMLWQPHIERIIHELRRSLAYYNEQSKGYRVGHFFFLGGGAEVKNLQSTLAAQIGGKCEILLPFEDMEIALVKGQYKDEFIQAPIFAAASGLAWGSSVKAIKAKKIINFLPEELKKKEVVVFRKTLLMILSVSLIFIFILGWLNAFFIGRSLKVSLDEVKSELDRVKDITVGLRDLKEREQIISRRSSQIEEIIEEATDLYYPLKRLSQAIPADIFLTKLSITESKEEENKYLMEISARVFADYEEANRLIKEFKQGLQSSADFTDINITPLELEEISSELTRTDKDLPITSARLRDFVLKAQVVAKQ
jgi:cell division ATPase FtsA